jgi:hypothetical protein
MHPSVLLTLLAGIACQKRVPVAEPEVQRPDECVVFLEHIGPLYTDWMIGRYMNSSQLPPEARDQMVQARLGVLRWACDVFVPSEQDPAFVACAQKTDDVDSFSHCMDLDSAEAFFDALDEALMGFPLREMSAPPADPDSWATDCDAFAKRVTAWQENTEEYLYVVSAMMSFRDGCRADNRLSDFPTVMACMEDGQTNPLECLNSDEAFIEYYRARMEAGQARWRYGPR